MLQQLLKELKSLADPGKAKDLQRFFKTGKGDYGEGDIFLGIAVPKQRLVAKKFRELPLEDIQKLLESPVHEKRFTALLILIDQYHRGDENTQRKLFNFYLKNTNNINNWDLVDLSAHKVVGHFLLNKDRKLLYRLAKSGSLWERRISIVATFAFIDRGELEDSMKLAQILLSDKHDLIHKAVGWVLREVGKKDQKALHSFLEKHASIMPRTMLRYAIEKLSEEQRKFYMKK